LPVVYTGNTGGAIRPVQTDSVGCVVRPSTDVDLSAYFVRQREASSTKDVSFDVHWPPGGGEVVDFADVKLVGACAVWWAGSPFFDKGDFSVDGGGSDEGDDNAADEELVAACVVAGGEVPGVKWGAGPGVVGDAVGAATDGGCVTRAGDVAVGLGLEGAAGFSDISGVATV